MQLETKNFKYFDLDVIPNLQKVYNTSDKN